MHKNLSLILLLASIPLISCTQQADTEQPAPNQAQSISSTNKPATVEQKLLDTGSRLWAENKPDEAEAEFRKAIKMNPKSSEAHARLAGLLLTQNKTSEAIPVYQDAISLNPNNPKLFASLSIAYLHQSQFSMAKSMADEALRLAPEMKQAKKLNEYIEAKQEVMDMAAKLPQDNLTSQDQLHSTTQIPASAQESIQADTPLNLKTAVGSRKSTQALGAPGKLKKPLITN